MKVLDARVRWYPDYANDPSLELLVDRIPERKEMRYKEIKVTEDSRFSLYVAELNGYVSFFAHDPRNEEGFGGAEFGLTLESGKSLTIKGPWSSRAGVINTLSNIDFQCLDVSLTADPEAFERGHTFMACSVTLEVAEQAIEIINKRNEKQGVRWENKHTYPTVYLEKVNEAELHAQGLRTGILNQDITYTPRKEVPHGPYVLNLPTAESILLHAYNNISEHGQLDIQKSLVNRIESYFKKYYGYHWKDKILGR